MRARTTELAVIAKSSEQPCGTCRERKSAYILSESGKSYGASWRRARAGVAEFGSAAKRLGRLAEGAQEGATHPFGVAKAGMNSDRLDWLGTALDPFACGLQAQAFDRLGGGRAGFGHEGSGEMALAHRRVVRQPLDRKPLTQPLARPPQYRGKPTGGAIGLEQRRELRLPAGSPVVDHKLLCHPFGDWLAEIIGDQRKCQVDAGRDPGRGPDLAVPGEDAVGLDVDQRIGAGQYGCTTPMSGGTATVEQSGRCENEGPRAHAGDPPGSGRRRADKGQCLRAGGGFSRPRSSGNDQCVERVIGEWLGDQLDG